MFQQLMFRYFRGVTGLMFLYLKAQELVNSLQRFGVSGRNSHPAPPLGLLIPVADLGSVLLHRLDAGWNLIVNKHWDREIPL